jgi:hypothetical protein
MANIVIGVNNLERALGQRTGVLDGNQYAIQDSAGRQGAASKVIALPTSSQK